MKKPRIYTADQLKTMTDGELKSKRSQTNALIKAAARSVHDIHRELKRRAKVAKAIQEGSYAA